MILRRGPSSFLSNLRLLTKGGSPFISSSFVQDDVSFVISGPRQKSLFQFSYELLGERQDCVFIDQHTAPRSCCCGALLLARTRADAPSRATMVSAHVQFPHPVWANAGLFVNSVLAYDSESHDHMMEGDS